MSEPSVTIIFDRISMVPIGFCINGQTDEETAQLKEIASRIKKALKGGDRLLTA